MAFAALTALVWYLAVAGLPFFSEDFTHLAEGAQLQSLGAALDPRLEPLRPFQHLAYYLLGHAADPDPAWLRALAALLHVGSVVLVLVLARALGAGSTCSRIAALGFLFFPALQGHVWGAAISGPLRAFFVLAALVSFVLAERGSRPWTCIAFLLALGAHESAIVLAALCVLWIWTQGARERLRDPSFVFVMLVALAHALTLAFLRPQRHHGLKSFASLPANLARASLAFVPECVRNACVEALRGESGTALFALACAFELAFGLIFLYWIWRASPALRFVLLALVADLVLPVLSVGFVERYAYLGGAFAACALALWVAARPHAIRPWIAALVVVVWGFDSLVDVREARQSGEIERQVLDQLRLERAAHGAQAIVLVDLPDMAGREHDLPLFNWGIEEMLRRAHIDGPWILARTRGFHTNSDVPLVAVGAFEEWRRQGLFVLEWDGEQGRLVSKAAASSQSR